MTPNLSNLHVGTFHVLDRAKPEQVKDRRKRPPLLVPLPVRARADDPGAEHRPGAGREGRASVQGVLGVRVETIGDATLYLGDCREVLPTVGRVDAVCTDPPYGVGFADWDQLVQTEWLTLAQEAAPSVYVTTGVKNLHQWPAPSWIAAYSYPNGYKRAIGGGFNSWEPVLIYGRNRLQLDHKQFPPVPDAPVSGHPCPKPLAPFEWLVGAATAPSETILDPFMGSGTTGVACARLGRRFIGVEIEEKYFSIACKRIEQAQRQADLFVRPAAREPAPVTLLLPGM